MNESADDSIQRLLDEAYPPASERPVVPSDGADESTYRLLFDALRQPPAGSLSPAFSATVVRRVRTNQRRSAERRSYAWLGLGILGALLASVGFLPFIDGQSVALMAQALFDARAWLLFGIGCLVAVEALDHYLIRKRMGWSA